jgi:hypothetical protein
MHFSLPGEPHRLRHVIAVDCLRAVETFETSFSQKKNAYADQLNSFTRLRALLVLHDRGSYSFLSTHQNAGHGQVQLYRCVMLKLFCLAAQSFPFARAPCNMEPQPLICFRTLGFFLRLCCVSFCSPSLPLLPRNQHAQCATRKTHHKSINPSRLADVGGRGR